MTIENAIELLRMTTWCQHKLAVGLNQKDMPDDPNKAPPKPHEVYPWAVEVARLDTVSTLGALCRAYMQPPNGTEIAQAMSAVRQALAARGVTYDIEAWNDAPGRTKDDVISVLTEALQYVNR